MQLPKFNDQKLFIQAFTHRSYLNEAKEKTESNERLEFLGDSILSFLVSDYLFERFPHYNEGMLTNIRSLLVNTKNLALIASGLRFGDLLMLSKGEEESKGRENQSLLADCFEAYVGALYIDRGMEIVKNFIKQTIFFQVDELIKQKQLKDPKSLLQESVQAKKLNSPVYKVLKEEGPPHTKIFTVGVYVAEKLVGNGVGKSKQQAEENAAKQALEKLSKE